MRWLQLTARRLWWARGWTCTALLTLAIGFGAAAATFSVVYAVLLRPLPYSQPDRLVDVAHELQVRGTLEVDQADASILVYQRHSRVFAQFGGYQAGAAGISMPGGDAERVAAGRVTHGVLDALGVLPVQGRLIASTDDVPGAPPVVLLAERLWTRRFGRDPSVLHRRILVDGEPREVVGILPDTVRFPTTDTEAWVPLVFDPAKTDSASFDYKALARLRDGVSLEQAEGDLQRLLLQVPVEFPGRLTRPAIEQTHMRVVVRPLATVMLGGVARLLWVVFGASMFVLFAACVNVACLFLVRGEARRRTFAIQGLLGSPAGAVLFEFLGELGVVTTMGATIGLGIAAAAARVIRSLAPVIDIPRLTEVHVGGTVIVAAGVSALGIAAAIAAFTAWRVRRAGLDALSALGPGMTLSRAQHRTRYALVALQVAVATVLVAGSGLMGRSLWTLQRVQPGFDKTGAVVFRLAFPPPLYPGAGDVVRAVVRLLADADQIPGSRGAAAASRLPLEEQAEIETGVFLPDRMRAPGELPRLHPVAYVTPDYFRAMRIPIVQGDSLGALEPGRARLEAVVSRAFVRRYWPDGSAVGRYIRILVNGPVYRIVGVAGDVRDRGLDQPPDELVYCPLLPPSADGRWQPRDLAFVVRTADDPTATLRRLRATVHQLDPTLPLYRAEALSDVAARSAARRELVLLLLATASVIAVMLGIVGLYGVMAYVVSLRQREIGIRMALGEQASHIGLIVASKGVAVAALGVFGGIAGAVALARALGALLYNVTPSDPLVLSGSAVFLLVLAAAASVVPSVRAASVDPALALRAE